MHGNEGQNLAQNKGNDLIVSKTYLQFSNQFCFWNISWLRLSLFIRTPPFKFRPVSSFTWIDCSPCLSRLPPLTCHQSHLSSSISGSQSAVCRPWRVPRHLQKVCKVKAVSTVTLTHCLLFLPCRTLSWWFVKLPTWTEAGVLAMKQN